MVRSSMDIEVVVNLYYLVIKGISMVVCSVEWLLLTNILYYYYVCAFNIQNGNNGIVKISFDDLLQRSMIWNGLGYVWFLSGETENRNMLIVLQ